jgi:hypothetical protein
MDAETFSNRWGCVVEQAELPPTSPSEFAPPVSHDLLFELIVIEDWPLFGSSIVLLSNLLLNRFAA